MQWCCFIWQLVHGLPVHLALACYCSSRPHAIITTGRKYGIAHQTIHDSTSEGFCYRSIYVRVQYHPLLGMYACILLAEWLFQGLII